MSKDNDLWIVVTGDPLMGYVHHGPFSDHQDAMHFAEGLHDEWHIAPLYPTEDE